MQSDKLQSVLNGLWTMNDVANYYGVVLMTVHLWRGKGLPAIEIPGTGRNAIRFVPKDVKAWCSDQGIRPKTKSVPRTRYRTAAA